MKNFSFRVRDGSRIRFWNDPWVLKYPSLLEFALIKVSNEEKEAVVKDFVTLSSRWDLQLFLGRLPEEVCDAILALNPPFMNSSLD